MYKGVPTSIVFLIAKRKKRKRKEKKKATTKKTPGNNPNVLPGSSYINDSAYTQWKATEVLMRIR